MKRRQVDRREFTRASVLALLAGVAITVTGCSDADGPTGPTSPGDRVGDVSNRHGHVAVITGAQLSAGQVVVLEIRGNAGHGHSVALTGDDVLAIGAGRRVVKTSSTDLLHNHTVTFN